MILLCDGDVGDVNYINTTLQRAIKNKIKVFPVLIGTTSGKDALQELADQTGATLIKRIQMVMDTKINRIPIRMVVMSMLLHYRMPIIL